MMKKTASRFVGMIMLINAIIFIVFALNHPEISFPWSNAITYVLYAVYLIAMIIVLVAPFKDNKS